MLLEPISRNEYAFIGAMTMMVEWEQRARMALAFDASTEHLMKLDQEAVQIHSDMIGFATIP